MKKISSRLLLVLAILFQLAYACNLSPLSKTVTISMVYGSEKEEWLVPLVEEFNQSKTKTAEGAVIIIEAEPMGSIESARQIVEGQIQPTVWSPASSIYIPVANAAWRQEHADALVSGTPNDLVLSPVVIAMWQPMAEVLGWPEKALGWGDIADLATSDEGWEAYGYPEWGRFAFGHTHPEYSNSGIVAIIAQAYSGAEKQRDLTLDDLQDEAVISLMQNVQKSIIHYGESTGFFANRLFERGPSYLSAAVMYENLVIAQESKRLNGESAQIPVVAIYPREGTFWSNHPYAVLNAPWVSAEQREAAGLFEDFLLAPEQQRRAIQVGFRPADPSIPLSAPIDSQHGVDPLQPQTVLEVPSAEVIQGIQNLWHEVKKPVDLMVVVDTSQSMSGDKISAVRSSLVNFIDRLSDRDRMAVILFSDEIVILTPLSELSEKRTELRNRVSGIIEGGNTRLYDGTAEAYALLEAEANSDHIRAIVVLSDGDDTQSELTLQELANRLSEGGQEGGRSIKLFSIAYGDGADFDVLEQMADQTGGRMYKAQPDTIDEIYTQIATFF